ncbi:MAG: HAD-IA family hydrolase [Alphaproteobacteria bacterium]|nr:HAD-IA family hydrolase [Alphaproteobacteria bacterium]
MIKYVIFDVGGVCYPYSLDALNNFLYEKSSNKDEFIKKCGVKGYDYNPYMRGDIGFDDFCKELCEYCEVSYYKNINNEINEKLHDGVGEFYVETIELINEIKKRGVKVGILSNALECLADSAKCLVDDELCFVSYELKCLKPDVKIYQKMIEKLNCKPNEIIFIDDKEKNVIGAKSLGINGIVYENNEIREKVIRFFS